MQPASAPNDNAMKKEIMRALGQLKEPRGDAFKQLPKNEFLALVLFFVYLLLQAGTPRWLVGGQLPSEAAASSGPERATGERERH